MECVINLYNNFDLIDIDRVAIDIFSLVLGIVIWNLDRKIVKKLAKKILFRLIFENF